MGTAGQRDIPLETLLFVAGVVQHTNGCEKAELLWAGVGRGGEEKRGREREVGVCAGTYVDTGVEVGFSNHVHVPWQPLGKLACSQ